jgi:hypothetical protein
MDNMDSLVNEAAILPRKLGLAPKNEDVYNSVAQQKEARYRGQFIISRDESGPQG